MHTNVCGKIEAKSFGGAVYFAAFIDVKSRFVWIYVLKHKGEVFKNLVEWKAMVYNSSGQKIKTLRVEMTGNTLQDCLNFTLKGSIYTMNALFPKP